MKIKQPEHQWLMPVILATQETVISRITVQSPPGQTVYEILSLKNPSHGEKPASSTKIAGKTG
jgi:hypothetical protein